MALQEALEAEQAVGDALGVVETVDAEEDDVGAEVHPKAARVRPHCGVVRLLAQAPRLDTHREHHDPHVTPRQSHPEGILVHRQVQEVTDAVEEALRIAFGLDADQVGAQHARQQLRAPRANAEHRWRREGQVPEETHAHRCAGVAQETGHEAEMEVVDPDEVPRIRLRPHGGREALVRLLVRRPERGLEAAAVREHVTQRPEHLVGEPGIEGGRVAFLQANGAHGILEPRVRRGEHLFGRSRGPGHPHPPVLLHRRIQRARQATHGASRPHAGGVAAHLDGRAM